MIEYIYSKIEGFKGEKYYQLYQSISKENTQKIISYIDLVGVPINEAIYSYTDAVSLRKSLTEYGGWCVLVERSIIKDMKRLDILEFSYKYKKKDK